MRLTRFPQSCLLLEKDDARILVDPGTLGLAPSSVEELGRIDAVLFTHQHADHCDPELAAAFHDGGAALYGNVDVASHLQPGAVTKLSDGDLVDIAGFHVAVHDLPHVVMVDGRPGPPNSGFLFDDTLFHPGDGIRLDGLSVDTLAVPIAGPSISNRDAYLFLESTGAARCVPIHYDVFLGDPDLFARNVDIAEVIVLGRGESTDL